MASVIAFDVNETLLDLRALDQPFKVLLGSAALRPQWFTLMLQLAFTGGLTGQYVDFTTAQRAALAMVAERGGVSRTSRHHPPVGRARRGQRTDRTSHRIESRLQAGGHRPPAGHQHRSRGRGDHAPPRHAPHW